MFLEPVFFNGYSNFKQYSILALKRSSYYLVYMFKNVQILAILYPSTFLYSFNIKS